MGSQAVKADERPDTLKFAHILQLFSLIVIAVVLLALYSPEFDSQIQKIINLFWP